MTRNYPERPNSPHRSVRAASEAGSDTARSLCIICQAVYVPSPSHTVLLQASVAVIESTFMSMCHFCFRCRRPACPSCWDDVHGICGDCVMETRLPFRSPIAPLKGSLFATTRRAQVARVLPLTMPLVCVRPGRFQRNPASIDTASTVYIQTPGSVSPTPTISFSPTSPDIVSPIEPEENGVLDLAEMATRPDRKDEDVDHAGGKRVVYKVSSGRRIGRGVFHVLLVVLSIAVGLVVAVFISPEANTFLANILHINIRQELQSLWNILISVFSNRTK